MLIKDRIAELFRFDDPDEGLRVMYDGVRKLGEHESEKMRNKKPHLNEDEMTTVRLGNIEIIFDKVGSRGGRIVR